MTAGKRIRYYGKKLLVFLLSVLALSLLVFYLARLAPGDPLVAYYGERTEKMSVEERERSLERLGLNDPIYVQYVRWVQNAAQGEFGISYQYKQPVLQVLEGRTGNTLLLGGTGFLLTFALALLVGVFCAWQEERWPDKILCKVGTLTSCIPEFWLCLLFILVFSVTLHWLPSSGAYATGQEGSVASRIQHLILPMAVIVLSHLWYYAYLIRNKILEEVRADYRAAGQGERAVPGADLCSATACATPCPPISTSWPSPSPISWGVPTSLKWSFPIPALAPCPTRAPAAMTIICSWWSVCSPAWWSSFAASWRRF